MEFNKMLEFDHYYDRDINQLKWFEPFVQPVIIEEYNNNIIHEGMSLLDVGAGCSMDTVFFASKGLNVTALDFSTKALDKLKKLACDFGVKISILNTSVLTIPDLYNNKFDIVSDNGCFHHIDPSNRIQYAESISRVLKADGLLYIRSHSDFEPMPIKSELRAYRLSSDDIISTFLPRFKFEEMYPFYYIRTNRGKQKVWFIKLRVRNKERSI